jgi:hypothetical protein
MPTLSKKAVKSSEKFADTPLFWSLAIQMRGETASVDKSGRPRGVCRALHPYAGTDNDGAENRAFRGVFDFENKPEKQDATTARPSNFMYEIEFDGRRPLRRPINAREIGKRRGSTMIYMNIRLRPDLGK